MTDPTNAPILSAEALREIEARADAIMPHPDTPGGHFSKVGADDHFKGVYHEDGSTYYVRVPAALRDSFLAVLENWPLVLASHRALSAEVARLVQLVKDHEDADADVLRLTRHIDVILHGEEGAAEQAMLCDVIGPIRKLKAEVARLADAERVAWCATRGVILRDDPSHTGPFAWVVDFREDSEHMVRLCWRPSRDAAHDSIDLLDPEQFDDEVRAAIDTAKEARHA